MDWVKFLVSVVLGLVALVGSTEVPQADPWVIIALVSGLIGYCAKTYFTFQANMAAYQNLITQSMYDKQLDSGRCTLLHLCDDVIQQEVLMKKFLPADCATSPLDDAPINKDNTPSADQNAHTPSTDQNGSTSNTARSVTRNLVPDFASRGARFYLV